MQDIVRNVFILFFCLISITSGAQVSGVVYDESGKALPYVTVYKEGTSIGTVSNQDGEYVLNIDDGKHVVVYKFIGYTEHKETIDKSGTLNLDVILKEESVSIQEVVVSADGEDPAYRVIRQAIKNKDKFKSQVEKYQVDLYVKGVVKMIETPKKIFGKEIGDMEGMLDTTGRGIVYLAESQTTLSFHQPNLIKEEMYSSIVAEDDGSYNFNRFVGSNFDIYQEYYEFGRSMISPIADNALSYYKYKLLETRFDVDGRLVNRIKVIPKNTTRPVFFGELYIIEDMWNVKELDLGFTGKAIKEPFFDTINIRQVHLPVDGENWKVFSQTMNFTLGALGFKVGGGFTYVFSDYNLNPDFDETFFTNEEFRMDEDAIKTDSSFWTSVRPVKLTEEEKNNYIKKDSLKKVWSSKSYRDSIDRVNNKFALGDLLFGYSYANSYKKRYISYSSPLTTYNFNPVEGHSLKAGVSYVKLDSTENRRLNIKSDFGYGFSDKRVKVESSITLMTNRKYWENWSLIFGDANRQLDERNPISSLLNTYRSLLVKDNQARFFRKKYVGFKYQREVTNGVFIKTDLTYSRRSALTRTSNYSFFNRDEEYDLNHPTDDLLSGLFFEDHDDLKFTLDMRFRIGQKYATYPKFILRSSSAWPDIWLKYEKGLSVADTDYDKLSLRIVKNDIDFNIWGYGNFNFIAGTFLTKNEVEFIDLQHFYTNENLITLRSKYLKGFKLMPNYEFSTINDYAAMFYEHNLNGFLLDLLPGVNKLGWSTVVGGNALIRSGQTNYFELSAGISAVKIGPYTLFRLDYAWSYDDEGFRDRGFVIGLSSLFE